MSGDAATVGKRKTSVSASGRLGRVCSRRNTATASSEWPPMSKKLSVAPDRHAELLAPDFGDEPLDVVVGGAAIGVDSACGCDRRVGRGQRLAVDLAVRRERERVEAHDDRRAP